MVKLNCKDDSSKEAPLSTDIFQRKDLVMTEREKVYY